MTDQIKSMIYVPGVAAIMGAALAAVSGNKTKAGMYAGMGAIVGIGIVLIYNELAPAVTFNPATGKTETK